MKTSAPLRRTIIQVSIVHAGRLGLALPLLSLFPLLPMAALAQGKVTQVVKPAIALAYIDLATAGTDMPGANMLGAGAQGAQSGGFFGALGGLARGAAGGATGGGNVFGNTRTMGFGSGKYMDVSVYTQKNRAITEAVQGIPNGMLLGESLKLIAPVPDKPVPTVVDEGPIEPTYEKPKGKISIYWGCSEKIRPGQPRTFDVAKASPADFGKFFVSRGSTPLGARSQPAHPAWPNKQDDRKVPDNASLVGQHTFSGNGIPESFKVSLGPPQDLMPPIELNQSKTDGGVNLEWQSIPHARGYFLTAMGGMGGPGGSGGARSEGSDAAEVIIWTSSELPDMGFGLLDYQSNANIDKWINEKVILPASANRCAVPAGIFGEQGGAMLRMIAYGSESYFAHPPRPADPKVAWEPEWQTKTRVKSTFMSMLGGFGDAGDRDRDRGRQRPQPREEKKVNPVDLLKGILGR